MFTGFYTTNKGHQYIAKAASGKTLVITRGQYGNGELAEDAVLQSMTALISPLAALPISKQSSYGKVATITTQFSNKVNGRLLEPFHLMEAGIFGKIKNADGTDDAEYPETLLYYANALTKEKADYIPGSLTEFIINWPLTISASEKVTVEIDKSLIYPTVNDLENMLPITATQGGSGSALTVTTDKELADGQQVSITLTEDLKAGATFSYNEGDAYPILNSNGTPVTEKQQVAGSTINMIYSEAKKCWYILGGGSVEVATEAEAKAGANDTKMMTPKKVKIYVDEVLGDVNEILDSINGKVV